MVGAGEISTSTALPPPTTQCATTTLRRGSELARGSRRGKGKKVTGVPIYLPGTQLGEMFANGPVMAATAADAVAKKENAPDERDPRSNGATRVCKWSGERACDRPVGPAYRHASPLIRWATQGSKRDMG
jgi:hypothetical protein